MEPSQKKKKKNYQWLKYILFEIIQSEKQKEKEWKGMKKTNGAYGHH